MSNDKILMPKTLTAENGAKGLMSGEFFIDYSVFDIHCKYYEIISVPVDWDTIKEIYKMAVDNLGVEL